MKSEIKIENRLIKDKEIPCYIPTINDIPILGIGYILKDSINNNGVKTDNYSLAEYFLKSKLKEIENFLNKNDKFINL